MNDFTEEVIKTIKSIPKGKVMTYGQIAFVSGNPHGSRQVARILHAMTEKYALPWHRVINSKGEISLQGEGFYVQKELLAEEGVTFIGNKIDLQKHLYQSE